MDKEQILEMIDGTFIPNNVKGITAQGVKNVLKEMVNFTPESSGGGSGAIIFCCGMPTLNDEGVPESFELTPEQQEQNVASYQAFKNATGPVVTGVDMSEFYSIMLGFYDMGITLKMSAIVTAPLTYLSPEAAEIMGSPYGECIISMDDGFIVLPDGSISFEL